MTRRRGSFSKCYDELFEFHLSFAAFTIYMTLKSYDFGEKGIARPGILAIAEKAGASERTVRNALRELERVGLITTKRRPNLPNIYVLHAIEDVPVPIPAASPLPAGLEISDVSTSGSAKYAPTDRQDMPIRTGKICPPGPAGYAGPDRQNMPPNQSKERSRPKREADPREKQTKEADQEVAPASGGTLPGAGAQVPQGKSQGHPGEKNDSLGAVSKANGHTGPEVLVHQVEANLPQPVPSPQPDDDWSSNLRKRLASHV